MLTAPSESYTLSLHDALPIYCRKSGGYASAAGRQHRNRGRRPSKTRHWPPPQHGQRKIDRKSTRLNSSHMSISYAVFCLKKKIAIHFVAYLRGWGDRIYEDIR